MMSKNIIRCVIAIVLSDQKSVAIQSASFLA